MTTQVQIPVEMHSIEVASDEDQVFALLNEHASQLSAKAVDIFLQLSREATMGFAKSLTTGKVLMILHPQVKDLEAGEYENPRYFVIEEEGFRRIF